MAGKHLSIKVDIFGTVLGVLYRNIHNQSRRHLRALRSTKISSVIEGHSKNHMSKLQNAYCLSHGDLLHLQTDDGAQPTKQPLSLIPSIQTQ